MALLDGILGGAQSVQAYGQQQFQNKLARDKFDEQKRQYDQSYDESIRQYDQSYDESVRQFNINDQYNKAQDKRQQQTSDIEQNKEDERLLLAANDKLYETLDMAGYISQDRMSLNYNKINEDIAAGRNSDRFGAAEQIILGFATQFGNLPEGSKATSVEALEGGGYAITVTNADGSKGVVTEDGTSGPESSVVRFQPGQLGRLANTQFQREVATNTTKFDATVMRTNLNLIDADSNKQAANDQERDFLAEKQYEKQVVDTAKQTGSVPLIRGVETAIADGGPEVTQKIGDDLGVPRPQTAVKTDAAQADDSETPADDPMNTWSLDDVDRTTRGGQLIASIEGVSKRSANPRGARAVTPEKQRDKLMARKAELEKTISNAEALRAKSPNFKVDPKRDNLPKNKAELEQINAYLDKDKPVLFAADPATDTVAEQAVGKTTEQIEQGVNDGTIKVDSATVQTVAEKLKREGIRELRDLKRLAAKDSAIARAAIIASSEDINIRKQMATEMTNILDTPYNSKSVNKKDMLSLQDSAADRTYKYKNLANDIATTRRSWNDAANKEASDVLAGAQDIFYGPERDEENFDYASAAKFLRGKPFNKFNIWLKQSDRTDEEITNAMPGMAATLSLTLAALAGEESGGIRESVIDFISRDEVEDSTDPADFDVSRIRVDDPGVDENGRSKATKIYYTDEDGNILDQEGGLQALKDLHPEMYRNALQIAIYNTRKANGG